MLLFKSIISAHDHVNSMPKDKAIAIATDKCSREKHSTQSTSPPWSNEKIAINKKQVSSQLLKCCKNTRHGAGGGTRTHTVLLPTDFESVTSANSITPAYQLFYYSVPSGKNQEKVLHIVSKGSYLQIVNLNSGQYYVILWIAFKITVFGGVSNV